jgi:regulatory protein
MLRLHYPKLWPRHGRSFFGFCRFGVGGPVAGTITNLKVQKRRQDRVNVYLDGRYAFSVPEIEAARLRRGQYLSDADIAQLQHRDECSKAYNLALRYLTYRPRSQAEVQAYLHGKGFSEEMIAEVLVRLQEAGLLDDAALAQYWVENRMEFRPKGPIALRYELRQKGVADETIAEALEAVDPDEAAYRASQKQARRLASEDRSVFFRRLIAYLGRRGFDYETARTACERAWGDLQTESPPGHRR